MPEDLRWGSVGDFRRAVEALGGKEPHFRRLARAWMGRAPWPDTGDGALPKKLREGK